MKIKAFAFAMLLGGLAYAQIQIENLPDSLRTEIQLAKTDSARIAIYSLETWNIRFTDPELAAKYSFEAIAIAEQAGLQIMKVEALTDLGYTYEVMGNAEKALKYYYEGYELANEISYVWGAIDGVTGSGTAWSMLGNPQKAIEMYSEAIYLSKEDKRPLLLTDVDNRITNRYRPLLLADAYSNIGVIYVDINQFEMALEYYQKSLELYPDDNKAKGNAFLNVGNVHLKMGNLDKAIAYFTQAKNIAKVQADEAIGAKSLNLIGSINRRLGKYDLAIQNFTEAIEKYQLMTNDREIAKVHANMGLVYFEMGAFQKSLGYYLLSTTDAKKSEDTKTYCAGLLGSARCYILLSEYDKASSLLSEMMKLSEGLQDRTIVMRGYEVLGELYEKTGSYKKAFENQKLHAQLSDSLFTVERSEQIAEMEAKYETTQKQRAIELLNAQNQINELKIVQQVNQRNILFIAVLAFMGLAFILYNRYKLRTVANRELKELDELKTRFFTNISHEFRTPLTLILGPLENKLAARNTAEEKEQLHLMKRNADRLLELINQLLDLSKLEAGKMNLTVAASDFNAFLTTTISSFGSLSDQKEIQLHVDVPREPFHMPFDKEKCHQIFFNLFSNAFKFTPAGGSISVSASQESGMMKVVVQDSGPGIAEQEMGNIFRRFHQLADSKNHQQGTGIGLALVKELVALHNGKVSVTSTLGKGTRFLVELPVSSQNYKSEEIVESEEQDTKEELTKEKKREKGAMVSDPSTNLDDQYVLVVEDNADVRNYIASILSENYQVISAINGKEGVEKARKHVPDLIVSDLMMPEIDGIELCAQIKDNEKTSHIPVVLLTAKADQESKVDGLETGADDYLVKPFNEKELLVRVKNLIAQRIKLRERFERQVTLEPTKVAITPPDEAFITKAMEVVEENITNFDFSVELFQKEMAMSRMQLHRKLKALISCSASEFIRVQRLKRAAQILETEGVSVSEAAYKSGFNNLSYFAKCFKEEFGQSPSEYPAQLQKN